MEIMNAELRLIFHKKMQIFKLHAITLCANYIKYAFRTIIVENRTK